ncbi:HlyD family secretion protein [Nitratidesulfovibrio vulgaris]|uniref:CusB-like barrel-sandwich hybrid domain-containing protein n=1 Tax=Nitratidesulfovibrio vulgaris (strain ATCC 29579 / DSM 644 / CCUG 34227 / NCIMB 8303 / VKM B-1760 / Hildenborough) TaxID=882 RepID=Q728G7_NITV2|nr:HlyD family efflux transporter periplasmic adaptor subunit [Nitratidesulfovibrio vulgaris]AAS97108.1 hypothetical protein DVU_2636 [Nitratidesulfovibrio vulgaris str. Hildenborough]ADP87577.1 hypothetical protein Deval_2434 [Nitratidesulfovibrio vulgaris RCH1]
MRIANLLAAGVCIAALAAGVWHYHDMGRVVLEEPRVAGVVRVVDAPAASVVGPLRVREGDVVAAGDELLRLAVPAGVGADAMPHAAGASHEMREREAHAAWQAASKVEEGVRRQLELRSTEHARALVVLRGMRADASVSYAALQRAERDEREARKAYDAARKSAEDASNLRAEAEGAWRSLREGRQMAVATSPGAEMRPVVHIIRADVAGIVTRTLVREGGAVAAGQPLLEIASSNAADLWVVGRVPLGREASIRKGMVCSVRLEGIKGEIRGRVVSLEDGPGGRLSAETSANSRFAVVPGVPVAQGPVQADDGGVSPSRSGAGADRRARGGEGSRGAGVWARVVPEPAEVSQGRTAGTTSPQLRYGLAVDEAVVLVRESYPDVTANAR